MSYYFIAWLVISIISIIVTIVDKYRAIKKRSRERVPESALLTLSALGGSLSMLITMLIIRHKTRKTKFMLGIPIIIIAQIGLVLLLKSNGVSL